MAHVYARPQHMLQTEEEVLDIVEDDPSTSTREIARQVNVSQHKVWTTLRENQLYPFHNNLTPGPDYTIFKCRSCQERKEGYVLTFDMEKTQRLLEIHRVSFQRIYDSIMAEMQGPEPNLSDIQAELPLLDQKIGQINSLNEQLLDLLLDADCNEEDIDNEVAKADDLTSKYNKLKFKIEKLILKDLQPNVCLPSQSAASKNKLKYPRIEFKKFGCDRKDWIPFWSQFKRIHNDDEIEKEDKFQFLIQSTIPKSRARELVESFPPSAENYNIAIDSLVSRFGKEELLVEYYVRELLKLVLTNLKVKMSLSTLYDKLESQLRSLETLGVTSEKYAAMLFPLVESSLPEELLRVWQRSQNSYANEESSCSSSDSLIDLRLKKLMAFLKKEVEDEEKISMAVSGFDLKSKTTEKPKETSIPTASGLINQQKSPVCVKCVFCKGSHRSEDCKEAQKMTLIEKKKILSSRGCCHSCLKFGHIARRCRVNIQCNNCKNRHSTLMCNKEESSEGTGKSKQNENGSSLTVDNLSNNTSSQVFLQTLLVELRSDSGTKCVRAIIDTGSQRSYINKFIADEMGYESLREETLIHALFGGSESEVVKHSEYRIQISDLWSIDILGISDPIQTKSRKELEQQVLEHFLKTVSINEEGRYEVVMPWIEGHPSLPRNFNLSKRRLDNLMIKLQNDGYYDDYDNVFSEWLSEGIIEYVPVDEITHEAHYLPHRHVIKLSSSTTKIRPVFDASAREKGYPSLNQCIEKGINLIELIPSVLLRFRLHKIGVVADIRKAFLQISLHNCVTSLDSEEELREFMEQSKQVMQDGKFDLRCWEHTLTNLTDCNDTVISSVLGMKWNRLLDTLELNLDWFHDVGIEQEAFTGIDDNSLLSLCPYKDEDGIYRLKTKITERDDLFDFRYPIILPSRHTVVALMNSRPLTYVSENTNDLVPLTPSMFLHDLKEVGVPDIDNIDGNCLNRHIRYRIHLKEELTRRFRSEYLSQLIIRSKNHFKSEIKVGDVVLIGSDALKRLDWPLGVVTEVFPGKDSAIRVVRLKTSSGYITRPIQRLYPLEINTGEDYHEIKEKNTQTKAYNQVSEKSRKK
ncbi:hypothetical protein NQ317_015232 [Molorchus minor]|uniref:DUF5641 domain-containing protein n=1 Tax=Molorchus minor TaxID=1323400 RepID=A0ABQ9JIK8_9CUCU|nr:hypothetical protein NQ317_015232 [Molorchus minor]